MSRVESRADEFHAVLEDRAVTEFTKVGQRGSNRASSATPVKSGHARDSHAWVVLDEHGSLRAGLTATDSGIPVPLGELAYPGGITLALVNLAGYWLWIEVGARGVPGRPILLSEYRAMGPEILAALQVAPGRMP